MRIDIWSDVICPWCYLGKHRFEAALDQLGWADEVTVRYRAYQLDPRATAEPKDLRAAIERKYGPGAFDGMTTRLTALGAEAGIEYRFDRALRVGTVDAHRLVAWSWEAGGEDAQHALVERTFRAYFTEGANVADHPTLVRLAVDAGLDGDAAAAVLADGSFADEVAAELEGALDRGITGVPAFVVDDRALIPGAQDVATFVDLLTRLRERAA